VLSFEQDTEQPEGQRSCAFVRPNARLDLFTAMHLAADDAFCSTSTAAR
jgi:hypothetical protein